MTVACIWCRFARTAFETSSRECVSAASASVLVADSSKFGKIGFVRVIPVQRVETLITDTDLQHSTRTELGEAGVEVIQV